MNTTKFWVRTGVAVMAAATLALSASCSLLPSSQTNPTKVAEDFLHAIGNSDAEAACKVGYIDDRPMKTADDRKSCVAYLEPILNRDDAKTAFGMYRTAKVTSAEVDGDEARVTKDAITGVVGNQRYGTVHLKKVDDKWWVELDN